MPTREKTYPSAEVLKSYWWYRLCQVLFWTILAASAVAGFYNGGGFIIDAVTATGINGAILYGLWKLVLYIAYGKRPLSNEETEHQNNMWKTAISATVVIVIWILIMAIFEVGNAKAIAPTAEDIYGEPDCEEYPESPRCYGPDPGMTGMDWLILLTIGGGFIAFINYETKKTEKARANWYRNERRRELREEKKELAKKEYWESLKS
jgi:hypothetical protein